MDVFTAAFNDLEAAGDAALERTRARLRAVADTLAMLGEGAEHDDFEAPVERLLEALVARGRELSGAARFDVLRYDADRGELYERAPDGSEIRVPVEGGSFGEAIVTGRPVVLGDGLYDDPRSRGVRRVDELTGARSRNAAVLPLAGDGGAPVGIALARDRVRNGEVEPDGFSTADVEAVAPLVPVLSALIECSGRLRAASQRQRAVVALMHATSSISRTRLDLDETLARVMDEAKELMSADRSTLWLLDREAGQLWTQLQSAGGVQEIRIPMNAGFAGLVATSGKPVNIPFDLYQHPNAYTAKSVDQKTGYRTCSLLCLPVHDSAGELIAVTQLVNKRREGGGAEYDPSRWPEAPDVWKASFTRDDETYMAAFNQQAGVALENAKLFATVRQQEQMQRDVLRNLSNGVIAADDAGRVLQINESARTILGLAPDEAVEGRRVVDLVSVEDADVGLWLETALGGADEKARMQFYPEQVVRSGAEGQRSVNISISSMADAASPDQVRGTLLVMDDISDEKRLKTTMYRYMTRELADQLLDSADGVRLGGERKHVSVLFSDIRSYTTLTENMRPEDVVSFLNEYFEAMVEAVFAYKGTLDKYIGDAIMAVFGSPLPIEDHAWCAAQAAVEMRHRLADFNAHRAERGEQQIRIGVGVNSDEVVSGNIGSSKRMEFTAIGDGINLGSRLEGVTKVYGVDVVISDETARLCGDRVVTRELDTIRVRGKSSAVSIFELVELAEGPHARPLSEAKRAQIDAYHEGLKLVARREYEKAIKAFERADEAIPGDKACAIQIDRCKRFIAEAPPDTWSGIWVVSEK